MLVLTRKAGEKIVVPECAMTITIVQITPTKVRLGISAPAGVLVHREEVWQRLEDPAADFPPEASRDSCSRLGRGPR
jgi:carbon storage regulator